MTAIHSRPNSARLPSITGSSPLQAGAAIEAMVKTAAMRLRTLVVDDEPVARRVLIEELQFIGAAEVVGEAENGMAALNAIEDLQPDLLLLDLQMPGLGGFDVVKALKSGAHLPVIIVVTAYDQYALRAFEAGAVDYLLKPVRGERLAMAIERACALRPEPVQVAQKLAQLQEIADERSPQIRRRRKIVAKAGEEYLLLDADEVLAFQADGDLVWVVTANKRHLATQTLRSLEDRLKHTNFRRVHRGALVNMDHVRKMSTMSSQRWLITLSNNMEFIVSKRLAHNVRQFLSW